MASPQLNIKISKTLIEALDSLIKQGVFRNRNEAVNEGIKLLIRKYKAIKIAEKVDQIAEGKHGEGSPTKKFLELREEEDKRESV
jgi:Arc/MetJ-type ribon-helix-helix transcriptional regulator